MRYFSSTIQVFSLIALTGCMNGPTFMQQSRDSNVSDTEQSVIVESKELNGAVIGAISGDSNLTQVVQASDNSEIAGSSVSFPPGSIAIDTDVSIGSGEYIANESTINELGLDNSVASAAPSVAISSTIAIDASQPFTVALPLPDSAGLRLADPAANIVVFYKVSKVVAGGSYTGVLPPDQIKIAKGFANITTFFFGTFQVAYMQNKVEAPVEVASVEPEPKKEPPPPVKPPVANSTYYVSGFQSMTFGISRNNNGGLQGWAHTVNPARAGTGSTITKDYIGRVYKGE